MHRIAFVITLYGPSYPPFRPSFPAFASRPVIASAVQLGRDQPRDRYRNTHMKSAMLRVLWVHLMAIAVVLGWGWDASLEAAPMFGLEGQGTTGPGGWNLTIAAQVTASGASGFAHLLGGVTGPVTEIILPTDDPG